MASAWQVNKLACLNTGVSRSLSPQQTFHFARTQEGQDQKSAGSPLPSSIFLSLYPRSGLPPGPAVVTHIGDLLHPSLTPADISYLGEYGFPTLIRVFCSWFQLIRRRPSARPEDSPSPWASGLSDWGFPFREQSLILSRVECQERGHLLSLFPP